MPDKGCCSNTLRAHQGFKSGILAPCWLNAPNRFRLISLFGLFELNMRISKLRTIFACYSVIGLCLSLHSAPTISAGDAVAGESKAALCAACHGPDGNSTNPEFPKIAGQIPGYVASQLAAYKSGKRPNDIMKGLMLTLTEQDMLDIDAFYSQQQTSRASISEAELASAKRGQDLYRRGLNQFSVPACMACHGPAGKGIPNRYPKVSGQFKKYLITTLTEFKNGTRTNEEMNTIAFRLSAQQIEDLAVYMQGLE